MPETVYQEPEPATSPKPVAPKRRDWKDQPRWVWILAAAVAVVIIAALVYLNRQEPAPVVLGASSRALAVSSNGELLAVGTYDGTLRLVSPQSGHTLAKTQLPGAAMALSFGPEGSVLALVQGQTTLFIFSKDLSTHSERIVQLNPRDVVWSQALDSAIVASGGESNLSPSLEFFPAQPMGIAQSTSQLFDLRDWSAPVNLAVADDGSRVAVTLETTRRANVILYDHAERKVSSSFLVPGKPAGVALSAEGVFVVSPADESITEISGKSFTKIEFPKQASTSPLNMIAVNPAARRAYTTGSLTFAEVDLDKKSISRTFELPTHSAAIVLSPDRSTAYLTFQDANKVGVLNLQNMQSYHEIPLR
jgi:DNA-binding beta-propeller fold protein YncE